MSAPLPHQLLWEARHLAEKHRMFIVEVQDKVRDKYVTAYVVYLRIADGRGLRQGKRRDPGDLLRLVKKIAEANMPASAPA